MANTGDKFVIEIDKVFQDGLGRELYQVKGFNSLVFDDYGLEKLTAYKEPEKATEPEQELTPAVGMVYQNRENPEFCVVVTGSEKGKYVDTVSFIERKTGKVGVMEPSVFFRHYRNTGESVSSYLEVVLGNLPF